MKAVSSAEELYAACNVVSLHIPATAETKNSINYELVNKMPKGGVYKAESARYYFASVTGVDRAFGQILDALKELGLDKNTIVVFASDHGTTNL